MKPFQDYEKWGRKEHFYVATTMSLLYKMLKYRVSIQTFIKLSGKYGNNWNNPFLRRILVWNNGYYDKFSWLVKSGWVISYLFILIGVFREKLLKISGWDTHAEFWSEPLLTIPKTAELWENKNGSNTFSLPASDYTISQV
ncbi:hypothetical protein [Nostoc favosum]|uniref:Uncharacterized protein n=1 Tax=Nostoc favosum CHAB5714 TaxID=2780399 RepID=A0ABS8ID29_9NOSO|nr:hypothetical protein [Nostoc favosum]MCC5602120.1 hypothetical protein [Nostoc favosum CHAB5714]